MTTEPTHGDEVSGAKKAQEMTARQGLIYAALVGWCGDDPSDWQSPVDRESLVAWGRSHCGNPEPEIEIALDKLIAEGLFKEAQILFEYYPDADEEGPGLDCTYDSAFLSEIPDGEQHREFWDSL